MKLLIFFLVMGCTTYHGKYQFEKRTINYQLDENIQADIYIPKIDRKVPYVLLVHGGGWSSRSRSDMDSIAVSLAEHGLGVMNISYHLAPGFMYPTQLIDLDYALKYLTKNQKKLKFDTNSLYGWGYSSGGHLISLFALKHNKKSQNFRFKKIIAGGTPFDLSWYPKSPYIKNLIGGYRDDYFDDYYEASPVNHLHAKMPSFFLYHAMNDRLVEPVQATNFENRLKKMGASVDLHVVPYWGHSFTFIFSQESVIKSIEWLKS